MFNLVDTPQKYREAYEFLDQETELGVDLEASVRDEWRERRVSALNIQASQIEITSIATRDGSVYVIDHRILREVYNLEPDLLSLFRNKILIGASIKYDLKLLYQTYGEWFEARDIIVLSRLIGNATGSKFAKVHGHSLKDLCRDWLNIRLEGKGGDLQGSDWGIPVCDRSLDNPFWYRKLEYAARDTTYLFPIYDQMVPVIVNPLPKTDLILHGTDDPEEFGLGMEEAFYEENETIKVTASMEYNGVPASKKILNSLHQSIVEQLESLAYDLALEFDLPIDTSPDLFSNKKVATEKAKETLNNPNKLLSIIKNNLKIHNLSNTQTSVLERTLEIMDKVYAERYSGDEESETIAEAIEIVDDDERELYKQLENQEKSMILESSPILKKIVEYRRLMKLEGMDLRKHINPVTNRIHANLNQNGTATNRFSCIAEGQRVMVPGGTKLIEEIEVGEYVYCYEKDKGTPTLSKVLNVFNNGTKDTIEVSWENDWEPTQKGSLICTPDHKIKTKYNGWVEAKDLNITATVYHLNNKEIKTDQKYFDFVPSSHHYIISIQPYGKSRVYDLEVEDNHNYIVEEVVVSNCNSPNMQQIATRTPIDVEIEVNDDGSIQR